LYLAYPWYNLKMKRIIVVDLAGALGNHIFLFEMANFS
jgi:hypothetical protein